MKTEINNFLEELCNHSHLTALEFYIKAQEVMNEICSENIYDHAIDVEVSNLKLSEEITKKDCAQCSKEELNKKDVNKLIPLLEQFVQTKN
jgi:hypothetical protein